MSDPAMAEQALTFMRKLSDPRLEFGESVRVFLRDGTERQAHCTHIVCSEGEFTQWYDNRTRKALDVSGIKGWLPSERGEE